MNESDKDFTPVFLWFGMAVLCLFAAVVMAVHARPILMLVTFALALFCITAGTTVGQRILRS